MANCPLPKNKIQMKEGTIWDDLEGTESEKDSYVEKL